MKRRGEVSPPLGLPTQLAAVLIDEALHPDYDAGMWCSVGAVLLPEALHGLATIAGAATAEAAAATRGATAEAATVGGSEGTVVGGVQPRRKEQQQHMQQEQEEERALMMNIRQSHALAMAVVCLGALPLCRSCDPTPLMLLKSCGVCDSRRGPYWVLVEEITRQLCVLVLESYFDQDLSLRAASAVISDIFDIAARPDETCPPEVVLPSSEVGSEVVVRAPVTTSARNINTSAYTTTSTSTTNTSTAAAAMTLRLNVRLGEALAELCEDADVLLEIIADSKTTGKLALDNWRGKYPLQRFVDWSLPILQDWLSIAVQEEEGMYSDNGSSGSSSSSSSSRGIRGSDDVEYHVMNGDGGGSNKDQSKIPTSTSTATVDSEDEVVVIRSPTTTTNKSTTAADAFSNGGADMEDGAGGAYSDDEATIAQRGDIDSRYVTVRQPTHKTRTVGNRSGRRSSLRRRALRVHPLRPAYKRVSGLQMVRNRQYQQQQQQQHQQQARPFVHMHQQQRHEQMVGSGTITTTTSTFTTARGGRSTNQSHGSYGTLPFVFNRRFVAPMVREIITVSNLASSSSSSSNHAGSMQRVDVYMTPSPHGAPAGHIPTIPSSGRPTNGTVDQYLSDISRASNQKIISSLPRDRSYSSEFTLIPRYLQLQQQHQPTAAAASPIGRLTPIIDFADTTTAAANAATMHRAPATIQGTSNNGAMYTMSSMQSGQQTEVTEEPSADRALRYRTPSRLDNSPTARASARSRTSTSTGTESNAKNFSPIRTLGELVRGSIAAVTVGYTDEDSTSFVGNGSNHHIVLEHRKQLRSRGPTTTPGAISNGDIRRSEGSSNGGARSSDMGQSNAHNSATEVYPSGGNNQSLLGHLGAEIWAAFSPLKMSQ